MISIKHYLATRRIKKLIRYEVLPEDRADAIYELIRLVLEQLDSQRPIGLGEYQIVSAAMMANVAKRLPNKAASTRAFRLMEKLARDMANNEKGRLRGGNNEA